MEPSEVSKLRITLGILVRALQRSNQNISLPEINGAISNAVAILTVDDVDPTLQLSTLVTTVKKAKIQDKTVQGVLFIAEKALMEK